MKTSLEIRHDEALQPGAERQVELDARAFSGPLRLRVRAIYRLEGKEAIELPVREIDVL